MMADGPGPNDLCIGRPVRTSDRPEDNAMAEAAPLGFNLYKNFIPTGDVMLTDSQAC